MELERELIRFDQTLGAWLDALGHYVDADWNRTPAEGVWTIAQVYSHLIDVAKLGAEKIDKCLERSGEKSRKTLVGRMVFLIGMIPPIRVKAPFKNYSPALREKNEVRAALLESQRALHDIAPRLGGATGTATHPVLGKLNGREWVIFAEMHFRHHLRQKKRIDALLARSSGTSR